MDRDTSWCLGPVAVWRWNMNGDLAGDSNTYCCNTNTSTAGRVKRIITLSTVLAAAGAQMEEWWGQLGPCDTALLCTVSRQAGHQPRAHSSGDYHGYYLLFTATPCVDVSSAAAVWMQSAELVLASSSHSCSLLQ